MKVRRAPTPSDPTKDEIEENCLTGHVTFRSWCRHSVRGRARASAHVHQLVAEHALPVISWDYGFLSASSPSVGSSQPAKPAEPDQSPCLAGWDYHGKNLLGHFVSQKGVAICSWSASLIWSARILRVMDISAFASSMIGSRRRTLFSAGRKCSTMSAEFGEYGWWLPLLVGKGLLSLDAKFQEGWYLGPQEQSCTVLVLTPTGVVETRDIRWRSTSERWSGEIFACMASTWQPNALNPLATRIGVQLPVAMEPPSASVPPPLDPRVLLSRRVQLRK